MVYSFSEVFTCGSIPIQVSDEYREFATGATSVADSTGITLAGISSMLLHNYICDHAVTSPCVLLDIFSAIVLKIIFF